MICVVYLSSKGNEIVKEARFAEIRMLVSVEETGNWEDDRKVAIDKAKLVLSNPDNFSVLGVNRQTPAVPGAI